MINRPMNYGCKIMIQKCSQCVVEKNLLLLEFIRTLKNKIYKYITLIDVYTDKL